MPSCRPIPIVVLLATGGWVAFLLSPAHSIAAPKHEVRAVWIATAAGLDWPKTTDRTEQQNSLRKMVRTLKAANFNTIFFQVRARGDAYYRSAYEPWAENLTGTSGKDPKWDPLAFLLAEAHTAGMEVHAWFNVFKVRGPGRISSPQHPARAFSGSIVNVDGEGWLDPGLPEVREYLVNVAVDLVRNYDIDGIQFDYIRYPGREFPDESTYRKYGKGMEKGDWRRANITGFVRAFHDSATRVRPAMKIGSAPIGVFSVGNGKNGWGAYHSYYQDSQSWLKEGLHDYLVPQIYWDIGESTGDPDFVRLVQSWQENSWGRHIYAGMAPYKPRVLKEIPDQIDASRNAGTMGQAYFRYEHIMGMNMFGGRYDSPANIPPVPWKDGTPPNPPGPLAVTELSPTTFHLEWSPPAIATDGDTARYYNIYRSTSPSIYTLDGSHLIAVTPDAATAFVDTVRHPHGATYYYAVSAFDKSHNESAPSPVTPVLVKEVVDLSGRLQAVPSLTTLPGEDRASPSLVAYRLPQRSPVFLEIITTKDGTGMPVATISRGMQDGGTYVLGVEPGQVPPGAYVVRLHAGETIVDRSLEVK